MYAYPVILPEVSNREDFLCTVAIFDDDTGEPIKLDGCTTATGLPFTGSAWTVTAGTVITSSTTSITIPAFPIVSAALSALSLVVPPSLAIVAGSPVKIADATGLNTMSGYVLSYTSNTGTLSVQIGMTFDFEIRRAAPRGDAWGWGYNTFPDIGSINDYGPLISAQLGAGLSIIDIGIVEIGIQASTFQRLRGGTYAIGLIMSDSIATRQIFAGTVPVVQGVVSRGRLSTTTTPVIG